MIGTKERVLQQVSALFAAFKAGAASKVTLNLQVRRILQAVGLSADLSCGRVADDGRRLCFKVQVPPGLDADEYCAALEGYLEDKVQLEPREPEPVGGSSSPVGWPPETGKVFMSFDPSTGEWKGELPTDGTKPPRLTFSSGPLTLEAMTAAFEA